MPFLGRYARFPGDGSLLREMDGAARRLLGKLEAVDFARLGISEYNERYWGDKLRNPVGTLQLYGYLLGLCLAGREGALEDCVLVDYGGGSGAFSLLAKELGVGRVVYTDIYDVSCADVKTVAEAVGIGIDDVVCGDLDALEDYLRDEKIAVDGVCSYDVIEHIHDIEGYLRGLRGLSEGGFRIVFASSANMRNPLVRLKWRRAHLDCEYKDRQRKWGHKERDSLRSYLGIRKDIIRDCDGELSEAEVEDLARRTRGLMKGNIEERVEEYKRTGGIEYKPDHPTNTCDPNTGNWVERLMEPEWLEGILREEGFKAEILSGYWPYSKCFAVRLLKDGLNVGIWMLGRKGLCIAPYYVVFGDLA